MRTEYLFSSQALPPYLRVPQSFLGLESDGGTRPSIFTAAPNAWRDLVHLSQDLLVCSRVQLTLPDISDDEGRNRRTHTHAHTLQTDRQITQTHTGDIFS